VTVTVQEQKNAPIPHQPFTYRIEEEYFSPIASAGTARGTTSEPVSSRHQRILELLPAEWSTRKEARKLIEPLLSGNEEARRKQWTRAIAHLKTTGQIEVKRSGLRKKT
jgi:hypothetical protein